MRALLLLLISTTAAAGTNEVTLAGTTRALRAPSADAVTADALAGGTLRYARSLDLPVPGGLALWAEAALDWGSATGTMFQTMATDVGAIAPMLGARAEYV